MLDIAQKYPEELKKKFIETWYDKRYQYYRDSVGDRVPDLPDNCYHSRNFVSLDKKGNIIGYIAYNFSEVTETASCFGIISFDIGNMEFTKDVLQVFGDIFFKYNCRRVEFWCFEDNPAIKGYRAFIKRFGGREVGKLNRVCKLMDGEFHNSVIFEILAEDLKCRKIKEVDFAGVPYYRAIRELAYQTGYRHLEFTIHAKDFHLINGIKFINGKGFYYGTDNI